MNAKNREKYKISASPQRRIFHRSMSLWLQCQSEDLTFDILLFASLEACEELLPGLCAKSPIDIALMLAGYRNMFPARGDSNRGSSSQEPIEYVMIKRFMYFTRKCQESVLYDDQTTFGPLQYLRQLLLASEASHSLIMRDFSTAELLNAISGSQSLYDDAHGECPAPMDEGTIAKCRSQLSSVSALARLFAGMALFRQDAYLEDIRTSFIEILEKSGTAAEISFAGIREEVQSDFVKFLRQFVNNELDCD